MTTKNLNASTFLPTGKISTQSLMTTQNDAVELFSTTQQESDGYLDFNLRGRINFRRVGWSIFAAFMFFNFLFGSMYFSNHDAADKYRQKAPQAVKSAPEKDDCKCGRQPKKLKPKPKKKRCS